VERRIEAGHRRNARQDLVHGIQRGQRLRLVEWRQVGEGSEAGDDIWADQNRAHKLGTAMDDAVADSINGPETLDRPSSASLVGLALRRRKISSGGYPIFVVQESKLQASRSGVDDQYPHGASRARSSR
jgi:hypothetical protein